MASIIKTKTVGSCEVPRKFPISMGHLHNYKCDLYNKKYGNIISEAQVF
jgi:hypothetical protein